ncbi:MAG: hypothetical protein ACLQKK_08760 [Rhodomicrobium sp.]
MAWRDSIEYWRKSIAPFAGAAVLLVLAAALILYAPPRGAAALLGVLAGAGVAHALKSQARYAVQMAVLWACAAVTADAAYARLNDQAPVTLANALTKVIDAFVKLAEPLIRGMGLTASDPRLKVGAVAPDFVWALILTLMAMIAIGFPNTGRNSR